MSFFEFFVPTRPASLRRLLNFLADEQPTRRLTWAKWLVDPIHGGWNSRLYRATSRDGDLAIKFTPRDERDRAGREFQALDTLQKLGLAIAPRPIYLDRDRYHLPVVVQEWLDDPVLPEPPGTVRGWQLLSSHLAIVHRVKPDMIDGFLPPAVFNFSQAESAHREVAQSWEKLPRSARTSLLREVIESFLQRDPPRWSAPQLALCRCDNNTLNFVRRPGGWASVDWENSGWGDPAFDFADLLTHPAYLSVASREWLAFTRHYLQRGGESVDVQRVAAYVEMLLVWWSIRFAEVADELARGIQRPRLIPRPANWATRVPDLYRQYLERARAALTSSQSPIFTSQEI